MSLAVSLAQLAVLGGGNGLLGAGRGDGVLEVVGRHLEVGEDAAGAAGVGGVAGAVGVAAEVSEQAGDAAEDTAALLAWIFLSEFFLITQAFFFSKEGGNYSRLSTGAAATTAASSETVAMEKRMLKYRVKKNWLAKQNLL